MAAVRGGVVVGGVGESRTATRRREEDEGLGNVNVMKREGTRDSKVPCSIDIERERGEQIERGEVEQIERGEQIRRTAPMAGSSREGGKKTNGGSRKFYGKLQDGGEDREKFTYTRVALSFSQKDCVCLL